MALYLAKQPGLFGSPLCRHPVVEGVVDAAIELVEIHGVQPVLEPLVLDLASMDRLFMLPALVGMAGHERCLYPFQDLFVEVQPVEQVGECLIEHLLADIFAAAITVPASAFVGMPRAVIVDVFALLDLSDNGAAAFGAGHQAGERELVSHRVGRHRIAARQDALHPLPQFDRYERFVLALVQFAVPLEQSRVEAVAQDHMDGADRNRIAALGIDQPIAVGCLSQGLQRILAGCVALEQLC